MSLVIVLLLIVLNGVFAMAEIAIVSSRKSRLKQQALEGNSKAQAALDLANNPNRFLSTVQVGITLVGVFAGAFGGATLSQPVAELLQPLPLIGKYSGGLSIVIVVIAITYLSLIIGELVPKRLALSKPEFIASRIAKPMNLLSKVSSPLVSLLSISTEGILKLMGIDQSQESTVSEDEVRMLIREGARAGVFEVAERDIVERTLRLGDKKVNKLMTSRKEIIWLKAESSPDELKAAIKKHPHSHFPVCNETLDDVIGIARTKELLTSYLTSEKLDLKKTLQKAVFVPETMEALTVLETFKKTGIHIALVVDEYGSTLGLITLTDILEEIVGDIPSINDREEKSIIKRNDGSYLVDGLVSIDEFKEYFKIKKLQGEKSGDFLTIGGFVMNMIERIPASGDVFESENIRYEVVDMDENRVDKILVTTQPSK